MSILVLAGDLTNYYLYKTLIKNGYNAKLEGFNHLINKLPGKGIVLKGYQTIIVPIPLTIDGSILYSPYCDENIHIETLFNKADLNSRIIGGPFTITDSRIIDITKNKSFTDLTVIPTCEEIIKIIIEKSDFTIYDAKISVIGNGRIANRLKPMLTSLGAHITQNKNIYESDIIIITNKDITLDKTILKNIKPDILILDVTSTEELFDKRYLKSLGINIIKARGLPGKNAPKTVSDYLYKTLITDKLI